ncbi:tubulin-specific chaperone A-like [Apodemus sylvaticus]|uniref:tubulin-specific chaperone A-like n=1 Tax=Apodemus sylvaticus TaxID=10129 RepID=UPI002242AE6C|nr:tubulin-specific chaperone A-like [Apodemus sylvaticus]
MYENEVMKKVKKTRQSSRKTRLEKMKAEDGESYASKKQAEILQESRKTLPDRQRRLEAALSSLRQMLESEKDLEEAKEREEARVVLDSVKLEVCHFSVWDFFFCIKSWGPFYNSLFSATAVLNNMKTWFFFMQLHLFFFA